MVFVTDKNIVHVHQAIAEFQFRSETFPYDCKW